MERAKCYEKMFYVLEVGYQFLIYLAYDESNEMIIENRYYIFSTIIETLRYVDT